MITCHVALELKLIRLDEVKKAKDRTEFGNKGGPGTAIRIEYP